MKIKKFAEFVNENEDFGLIGKAGRDLFSDRPDSLDAFRNALSKYKNVKNIEPITRDQDYRDNFTFEASLNGKSAQFRIVTKWTKLILECPELELRETVLTRLDQLDELLSQEKI